ncbi:hypothetical protein E2C01_002384 [Portunus trituberculatus]|uniref:Uncharacterized protein n=1 Tax=Portunus trituberculatus TaxID=210409 RepID=A0A5B7CJJ5_PORTR|nr:hypothetical protein [Portunus trituberculatus]
MPLEVAEEASEARSSSCCCSSVASDGLFSSPPALASSSPSFFLVLPSFPSFSSFPSSSASSSSPTSDTVSPQKPLEVVPSLSLEGGWSLVPVSNKSHNSHSGDSEPGDGVVEVVRLSADGVLLQG